jgi:hypothetical protein
MGIGPAVNAATGKTRKSTTSAANHIGTGSGSPQQISVEEEGASYLSRHGAHKRNTVHALAAPPISALPASHQRYARTPYAKQSPIGPAGNERRSSWASSSNAAAHLNPQQYSRLNDIYAQSVKGNSGSGADVQRNSLGTAEQLNSIQQLQLEFQKLRAGIEKPGNR